MGGSDCEHIGRGLLAQPANTLSSLAYVLSGVVLLWRALAGRPSARLAPVVYAVTVIGVGIMCSLGSPARDTLQSGKRVFRLAKYACSRSCPVATPNATGNSGCSMAATAPPASSTSAGVTRSAAGRAPADGRVWIVAAGVLAVGVLLNALGRTDAPLCEPEAPVQLHAVWHVLTAFVLFLYGTAVLGPREQARPKIRA